MKELQNKKILILNKVPSGPGGARNVIDNMVMKYNEENTVDFIDYDKYKMNKLFSLIFTYFIVPFINLYYTYSKKYDVVIANQWLLLFPLGRNKKCEYYIIIHHPISEDIEVHKNSNLIIKFKLNFIKYYEKICTIFCSNVLTDSEFSKNKIKKHYTNLSIGLLPIIIDKIFYDTEKKKYSKTKNIFLPNIYREERKGGVFITPILIKLAPILKEKKIKLLISNKINLNEQYEELSKYCTVENLGDLSYEELAKLYSTSLVVLTPAILEGYGLVPLEVIASGGNCISAPFPSLGFDNISVNSSTKKTIVKNVIVLEHDSQLWYKEINEIISQVKK